MDDDSPYDVSIASVSTFAPSSNGSLLAPKRSVVIRPIKKLPWLDGTGPSRTKHANLDDTELSDITAEIRGPAEKSKEQPVPTDVTTKAVKGQVSFELALDAAHAEPRESARRYSPSLYSMNRPRERFTDSSHSYPRRTAGYYEKLLGNPSLTPQPSRAPIVPQRVASQNYLKPRLAVSHLQQPEDGDISLLPLSTVRHLTDGSLSSEDSKSSKRLREERRRSLDSAGLEEAVKDLQNLMAGAVQLAERAGHENMTAEAAAVLDGASAALERSQKVGVRIGCQSQFSDQEKDLFSDESMTTSDSSDVDSVDSSMGAQPINDLPSRNIPREPSAEELVNPFESPAEPAPVHDLRLPSSLRCFSPRPPLSPAVFDFAYEHGHRPSSGMSNSPQERTVAFQFDNLDRGALSKPMEEPIPYVIEEQPRPVAIIRGSGPKRRRPRKREEFAISYHNSGRTEERQAPGLEAVNDGSSNNTAPTIPGSGTAEAVPKEPDLADPEDPSRKLKYKRRPIAREWDPMRKRITAGIACVNSTLAGLIAGIYAGEVPRIQYQLADVHHRVIWGNVLLFIGLGITTLICWPLPLLHGRKPYILVAMGLTLPLQFPQALAVSQPRAGDTV